MESFMNALTDRNSGWWPFLRLRPQKDQMMTTPVVAKISCYFGPFYGGVLYVLLALKHGSISFSGAVFSIAFFTLLFFVLYRELQSAVTNPSPWHIVLPMSALAHALIRQKNMLSHFEAR
jgi:hypothetical protein